MRRIMRYPNLKRGYATYMKAINMSHGERIAQALKEARHGIENPHVTAAIRERCLLIEDRIAGSSSALERSRLIQQWCAIFQREILHILD